jgi:HSP90 family molecular chaperone
MKTITTEEYNKTRKRIEGNWSPLTLAIINLQVSQHLLIEKADWTRKKAPFDLVRTIRKKTGHVYLVEALLDNSGWFVTRTQ